MIKQLEVRFAEGIPEELQNGILYISIRFRTTSHLCACGCGERVVAKLSPEDWSLLYNGCDVTLSPSIGNWTFECRSHYFVRKNHIVWAEDMSDEQIAYGRRANARRKKAVFETKPQLPPGEPAPRLKKPGVLSRLWMWISSL